MLQTLKNKSKRIASTFAAGVLLFSQFAIVPSVGATNWNKVTICHATGSSSNPYTQESVDDDAVDGNGNGSSDHNRNDHQNGEDIIPPTSVDSDSPDADGRNWTVTNQKIWANDCETTRIEVRKIISPSNDTGLFNLKVDEEHDADTTVTNVGNNGSTGEVYIDEHDDVTVAESAGDNTSLDDYTTTISCVNQSGAVTLSSVDVEGSNRGAKIDSSKIKKGDSIVCTFTNSNNTPTTGSLIVKKDVVNGNGNTKKYSDFHYTNNDAAFTLDADATDPNNEDGINTTSFKDLPAGATFNVVETDANTMGYATDYDGCEGTIEAGVTKVCTITNDDIDPTLTLVKKVVKDNGGQASASDWTLKAQDGDNTPAIDEAPSVVIDENTAATDATEVTPGSYDLSEYGGPNGYAAGNWECDGGSLDGNVITLTYGDHVTCTITNDDIAPKLTIYKYTAPNQDPQDFTFTSDQLGNFTLDNDNDPTLDNNKVFTDLQAGEYSVTEGAVDNWQMAYAYCFDGENYFGEPDDTTLNFNLNVGDDIDCYFYNVKQNTITGHKFNDINGNHKWDENEPGLANWTITITKQCEVEQEVSRMLNIAVDESEGEEEECVPATDSTVTDENGAYSFTDLDPGTYTVCEVQQDKWTQTFPQDNNGCHEITIEGAGEVVTANFGNKAKPQVLSETTTQQLVNTGASTAISAAFGLVILSVLATVHFLARRKSYQD